VASFATASAIPPENWLKALNDILPSSMRIQEVIEAAPEFHARKSARAKTYRYRIYRDAICPPFLARYVWHYPYPLQEPGMINAAKIIAGEHDFTSFAAVDQERVERMTAAEDSLVIENPATQAPTHGNRPTNIRTIFSSSWERAGEELIYTVRGSGFLHHMVRNLVGTFLLVGKGTVSLPDFERILAARNRSAAGATAPASGLYLVGVEY
jgi:tRNA pseudouridine38-40 synthase